MTGQPVALTRHVIGDCIRMNLKVLRELYDVSHGTFNSKIFAYDGKDRFLRPLSRLGVIPLNLIPDTSMSSTNLRIAVETKKDLKYIGHACVGLSWYLHWVRRNHSFSSKYQRLLLSMLQHSLEYLSLHQTSSGHLRCRYVSNDGRESGNHPQSIAEATNSFLWASAMAHGLDTAGKQDALNEGLARAVIWLQHNTEFLGPQEKARLVYALAQIYELCREPFYFRAMIEIGKDLVSALADFRSFGYFADDVDTLGALSLLFLLTENQVFLDSGRKLAGNQIDNQGAGGQWRWTFDKRTGRWRPLFDVTYTVHQLGMGPFALSLYLAASRSQGCDISAYQALTKGVLWVLRKNPFVTSFIIRSFAGLTGRVWELEQRAYEPGLNLAGLISYDLLSLMKAKGLPGRCIVFPWESLHGDGFHPYEPMEDVTSN